MKYIGNYANYIKDEWTDKVLALPREWPKPFCEGSHEQERLENANYDLSTSLWAIVEEDHVDFKPYFPFLEGKRYEWWIARLLTGQLMPMHVDAESFPEAKDAKVYWIPMQDYHSGHVFIINDELIKDYKKGDVYEFNKFSDYHGASNIGLIPKLTIIIVAFDD
jgi:hypothetical protein